MLDSALLRDRFRGALVGGAIGDAVGTRAQRVSSALAGAQPERELKYTAATELSIAVARSIIDSRGFSGPHQASTLVAHYRSAPDRGFGLPLVGALEALESGVPWHQAGYRLFRGSGSFSCEPALRIAPVALFAFRQPAKLQRIARDVALVTHHNELAVEGAVIQAAAIGAVLERDELMPINRYEMVATLRTVARHSLFAKRLDHIPSLLNDGTAVEARELIGTRDAAYEAGIAALYAFMGNLSNFADTIAGAVRLSSAPETPALAGALSGAYLGLSAIPGNWSASIEHRETIMALADDLLVLAISQNENDRCVA